MKKCAALIVGAALLTGCRFDPFNNNASGVYGPPPSETSQTEESVTENTTEKSETDISEDFSPEDNQNGEVYGPPPSDEDREI